MYNLRRISDNKGESGSLSQAIKWGENIDIIGDSPIIGCCMRVGSSFARTYNSQDWWLTTNVIEILEEIKTEECFYVKFKTTNSVYEWWTGVYPFSK